MLFQESKRLYGNFSYTACWLDGTGWFVGGVHSIDYMTITCLGTHSDDLSSSAIIKLHHVVASHMIIINLSIVTILPGYFSSKICTEKKFKSKLSLNSVTKTWYVNVQYCYHRHTFFKPMYIWNLQVTVTIEYSDLIRIYYSNAENLKNITFP